MRVMVLVKATADSEKGFDPTPEAMEAMQAMDKFNDELVAAGIRRAVGGLKPSSEAKRIAFDGQSRTVIDGPFDPPGELVAGFWIWEVKNMDEAMSIANDVNYGLTAGFYGSPEETEWFFDKIEAGVTYANRPQGATTGAWPGFQPFGGWKGSGSSGKNAGGHYYLPLYMHEQIRTLVK